MNIDKISNLVNEINELQDRLKEEIEKKEKTTKEYIKNDKICFDKIIKDRLKNEKISSIKYLIDADILYILTAPIIYFLIVPAIFLDICVSIYQAINFRVYKIKRVKRGDYIVFDRHHLPYLNTIEKINCLYCSYFNGLIAYIGEIAARTEAFWCPIRHAKKIAYRHSMYDKFIGYTDAKDYKKIVEKLRSELSK